MVENINFGNNKREIFFNDRNFRLWSPRTKTSIHKFLGRFPTANFSDEAGESLRYSKYLLLWFTWNSVASKGREEENDLTAWVPSNYLQLIFWRKKIPTQQFPSQDKFWKMKTIVTLLGSLTLKAPHAMLCCQVEHLHFSCCMPLALALALWPQCFLRQLF